MNNWKDALVLASTPLVDTIRIIDSAGGQIAIVTDENGVLLGTVTDADIRKALLRGSDFHEPCATVMSTSPIMLPALSSRAECLAIMRSHHVRQLPLVDDGKRVVDVVLLMDLMAPGPLLNPMVIMAGGLGSRLAPLTKNCPKPLLKVGNKPLLETILEQAISQGFSRFFLSVNYKAHMISDYFGDGSRWGVQIEYLLERERLGTAGSLHMLPETISADLVVMNGDILTKVDFGKMLQFHRQSGASATMAVKDYVLKIPYGVVEIDDHCTIGGFHEKPSHRFFVNAGVYILSSDTLKSIPNKKFFDMPSLFESLRKKSNLKTCAFPLREYWMDIGIPEDYEQANYEYAEHFMEA